MSRKIKSCFSRLFPKGAQIIAALLAILLLCGGCSGSSSGTSETVRIGVALYSQDDTFISAVTQQMEQLAREYEGQNGGKINLNLADGQRNQTIQLEQIDRFLDSGCDVLCVNIVDRTAAAVLIDKAASAGIPVIFFNRQPVQEDLQRWDKIYYVGPKGEQSGIYQGEILLQKWNQQREQVDRNGDGIMQYVMLEGEPGHQDALLRTEYATKPLIENGVALEKLASNTANWSRAQAVSKMKQWCQEFGSSIEAVIANNDDMALGAIDAMKEMGIDPLPMVVGVDATAPALEALEEGSLLGTVQNAPDMPEILLQLSLALATGQEVPETITIQDEHYVWLPYHKITKETIRQIVP